jgi:hypothetical protein
MLRTPPERSRSHSNAPPALIPAPIGPENMYGGGTGCWVGQCLYSVCDGEAADIIKFSPVLMS